jgi:hypothetical protein
MKDNFVDGYVFHKLFVGLYLWHIAIEQLEYCSKQSALVPGVIAICFIMEAIRLLREKCRIKQQERKV